MLDPPALVHNAMLGIVAGVGSQRDWYWGVVDRPAVSGVVESSGEVLSPGRGEGWRYTPCRGAWKRGAPWPPCWPCGV